MSAPLAALLGILLAAPCAASDPRLRFAAEPEPGSFHGLALSQGPGRPVCARATFDRRKAAAGGRILILDGAEPGDEDAIRMSQAVIARRGGLTSRAALAARRHGVPAVALGRGVWDPAGPALLVAEPVFGPSSSVGGVEARPAAGTREAALREDSAMCVDAPSARVLLLAPDEAEERVAAAEAARAYDGLRDAGALERWLDSEPGASRAAALCAELVPRAAEGAMPFADLARLTRAARAHAGAAGRERLARAERRAFARAARAARAELASCPSSAADAPSAEVLARLASEAKDLALRVAAIGGVLGTGDGGAGALARACGEAAARRRKSVPVASPSLEEASLAAGADRSEVVELPPDSWRRFVSENGLSDFLSSTLDDASLGLRRKSARVRERLLAARLEPASQAGRAALAAATVPVLVVGEDATLSASAGEVLTKVREAWAASWAPGPLGARLRAGRGSDYAGRMRLMRLAPADVSGLAFSRDPGSGRRGRILVEAAPGGIAAVLEGGAASARRALDARTGRMLESQGAEAGLTPARLKRLARLVRGLDAWRGGGVETAFSFAGGRLLVHHVRPLEPPAPARPVLDPFSPRPAAQALPVIDVR
ncbi:MAG TPA: hypothetical protein DCZ01_08655 [Elusimicrobia bacterium]|nr:MAG: hypothetical protein A2X37_08680 [Elusimicrobia bacterium GWA2_66_18]HAZ08573.1 hypothetical protein [Elusimicrobiota bacterium]